jgi:hypothetical protein
MISMATTTIDCKCKSCGKEKSINVNERDVEMYNDGMAIQDAFPYLFPQTLAFMLYGLCDKCYDGPPIDMHETNVDLDDYCPRY